MLFFPPVLLLLLCCTAEALQVEGEVAVGLDVGDVSIFAVSPESSANELLLLEVVEALRSVLSSICKYVADLSFAVAKSAALVVSFGSGGGTGGRLAAAVAVAVC